MTEAYCTGAGDLEESVHHFLLAQVVRWAPPLGVGVQRCEDAPPLSEECG